MKGPPHVPQPASFGFDRLLAAVPGERLGHELEVLLTTTDPDEVLEAQREFELTFLPSGAEADALWSKYFR